MLGQSFLKMFLYLERKSMLEETRHILAVMAMTITNREEVAMPQIEHVGICQIGILVHFIRIVSSNPSFRREREFCDDVMDVRSVRRLLSRW